MFIGVAVTVGVARRPRLPALARSASRPARSRSARPLDHRASPPTPNRCRRLRRTAPLHVRARRRRDLDGRRQTASSTAPRSCSPPTVTARPRATVTLAMSTGTARPCTAGRCRPTTNGSCARSPTNCHWRSTIKSWPQRPTRRPPSPTSTPSAPRMLRAVSHDLRTPLASIKAMVSGLRDPDRRVDPRPDRRGTAHRRRGDRPPQPARRQPARREPATDRHPGNQRPADRGRRGRRCCPVQREHSERTSRHRHPRRPRRRAVRQRTARTKPRQHPHQRRTVQPARIARSHRSRADRQRMSTFASSTAAQASTAGDRDRVIQPFQRLGDVPVGDGVGLGLSIANGFVTAMGGSLLLDDTPGGGLTVTVVLPRSTDTRNRHSDRAERRMTSVLIVDDERQIRRALSLNFGARGYQVHEAATGEAALTEVARVRPDIVLLDLGLPGMSGLTVLEALRGWTDIPIIVLTARDEEASKVLALDAGADDYVTKPFGMAELVARVRAALRRSPDPTDDVAIVRSGQFDLDLAAHRAFVHTAGSNEKTEVRLTPTEWAHRHPPRPSPPPTRHLQAADRRRVGPRLRTRSEPPARPHGPHTPQTRIRPRTTRILHHRRRGRLPIPTRAVTDERPGPASSSTSSGGGQSSASTTTDPRAPGTA